MKRLLLSAFTVLVFACSLLLEQIVIACGGGEDPYDYYYSFFHNNTAGSNAYMPFYFVTGYQYYEDWGYDGHKPMLEDDQNLKEWISFGQKKFTGKDASDFIYRYGYAQLSNLYYHIEKGNALQLSDSVKRNSMTQWFLQDKDLEALGYLMFAKKCEAYAVAASQWDAPPKDAKGMSSAIKGGMQLWKAAKKDFFQWRYAYQVLRMTFYSNDYKGTFDRYKELIGDKTADNIMYYRCLSLKAGAFYKVRQFDSAAYLYSLAFNGTDDQKAGNYISYDWCFGPHGEREDGPRANRSSVLKMTQNNTEKAVIAVMDALHEYGNSLALMKEAYQFDPKAKGLDVVMTREINKMEMSLLDPRLRSKSGFRNTNYPYADYYYNAREAGNEASRKQQEQLNRELKELIAFGSKLSAEGKTSEPAFWPLSVAYLHFIQEDWKSCEEWIAKAAQLNPGGKLKNMLEMERLLLAINKSNKLDAATEASILPSMQWLEQQAVKDGRFAISYRNLMTSVLPNIYMRQQDTMKALLCIAKGTTGPQGQGIYTAWYAYGPDAASRAVYVEPGASMELEQITTARVIAIKDWIKGAKKTPYEAFLVKYQPYQQGALDQYIGTRYLRQLDFAQAVSMFKNVPEGVLNQYRFPDPFAERWIDTQEPSDTVTVSNKYLFAKDMLRLQEQVSKDGADAALIYRYANGLYSMTYYGLSWKAAMYYRSGTDPLAYYDDAGRKELLPEYRNYYSAEQAARFYQLAFDKAKDKELKAKCMFMLSKCWQKNANLVNKNVYDPQANDEYYRYTAKSPYFKQLAENYSQTNIFKSLHEDCSYLRFYVRKIHKQ
jgi:hypothetical protein